MAAMPIPQTEVALGDSIIDNVCPNDASARELASLAKNDRGRPYREYRMAT
jgi:hypothetical protein